MKYGSVCSGIEAATVASPIKLHGNYRDLTGRKVGRLTALYPSGRSIDGHITWACRCACGELTDVSPQNILRANGGTRSCGCLRREIAAKRNAAWNKGATYAIADPAGKERIYTQRHSWTKAAIRAKGNKCSRCGWHEASCDIHHIRPRGEGGLNTVSNAEVLCPNCHRIEHERRSR